MDLRFSAAEPTADERAAVDAVLGPPRAGWDGGERAMASDGRSAVGGLDAAARRDLLLPALHALQRRAGWLSPGGLDYVCRRLSVPPAEAWGVATFYHGFATEPTPPVVAAVCDDLACRLRGAERLCTELGVTLGPAGRPAHGDDDATWKRSPCLGQCERAPAALISAAGARPHAGVLARIGGAGEVAAALAGAIPFPAEDRWSANERADLVRSVPQLGSPGLRLLRRVGAVDPTSLDGYRASGGYRALARALELGPAGVVAEVTAARLVGRGGAAFPTGRKWEAVARTPAPPRYIVCNADESEPGTFKDRILVEQDPFTILEAMTIAGFAVGAERGYVYLRGEYPHAFERLTAAIAAARAAGWLGDDVAGAGLRFEVEVRRGADAYICGEETALMNSIEGRRGEPRSKPPFPTEVGLFGRPTVVNNVETLANVPDLLLAGGAAWAAATGTEGSAGTKLFCVSGRVVRPGLYEVPFGTTLGELLELAGGVDGDRLGALLLGGAAGTFVGAEALAMPLTFEGTRAAGVSLGSGVVLVYGAGDDLGDALLRIAEFFRHESCGQCVPCRIGTVRQQELLERLRTGRPRGSRAEELALFAELAQAMRDASICGLGQTASAAIASALDRFDPFPPPSDRLARP